MSSAQLAVPYGVTRMLILTRKIEESIKIGDTITIKILSISDGQVKIGIDAPKDLKVHRTEVYEEIQRQNVEVRN